MALCLLLLQMELSPRSTLKHAPERATQNLEASGNYANNRPRAYPGASFKEGGSEVWSIAWWTPLLNILQLITTGNIVHVSSAYP